MLLLKNRALIATFAATFAGMSSFYILLAVVPLYVKTNGAGDIAAGFVTGLLMLATIGVEFAMPGLTRRIGYRRLFAIGLFVLGAPALLLPFTTSLAAILAISAVRGMGFAVVVTAGPALAVALVEASRRSGTLGLYGAVSSLCGIIFLPLGVWVANHFGYEPVFIASAVLACSGIAAALFLPAQSTVSEVPLGMLAGLRSVALLLPSIIFLTVAMASGIINTFLPIVFGDGNLAALALLTQAIATTVARLLAGRFGDRHGSRPIIIPALLAASLGIAALALAEQPHWVIIGMIAFGAGFGGLQNATLMLMFARVPKSGFDTASAVWNLAYDVGNGIGAIAFGLLAVQTGYATAFMLTASVIMLALVPAWIDRKTA